MNTNIKKRIAHLTSVHPRYDTRIFLKECQSLAKHGYCVSLVVADSKGDEIKNRVSIYDVGKLPGRINRILRTTKKVYQKALELDCDSYHLHDPELLLIGLKLKMKGKKVIYDMHENLELQILEKKWIPKCLRTSLSFVYSKLESYCVSKFDKILVPQQAMTEKYGYREKTELISNFPNAIKKINRTPSDKFKLLYSGSIEEARGLFNILNLAVELNSLDERYSITLAGGMSGETLDMAKKHIGWKYINYLGLLTSDEIYAEYLKNDIGLILFNNVGQYYMAYSLKLFEYMQNGLFVVMPDFGDWLNFNACYCVGKNVDTKNAKEVALIIHRLSEKEINDVGRNNMTTVKNEFTWESHEAKLMQVYEGLLT